jgi:2-polyprenyl-3-methyl-5-hydroxy-6-metoxy-1,4-benzoquinol methylase
MYKKSGVKVFYGFYPNEQVSAKETYDFIIFNDVFEHIPQLEPLIQALRHDLKKEGLLIINIPMSSGFFYKTACFLHSIGISSYLERMWQFHFHSPHMNYFNQQNLSQLLARHNFTNIDTFKLESLDFKHLKERVASDKKVGKLKGFFLTTMLSSLKPFINSLNPDIKVLVFKKNA